jgi:hypothetical protein
VQVLWLTKIPSQQATYMQIRRTCHERPEAVACFVRFDEIDTYVEAAYYFKEGGAWVALMIPPKYGHRREECKAAFGEYLEKLQEREKRIVWCDPSNLEGLQIIGFRKLGKGEADELSRKIAVYNAEVYMVRFNITKTPDIIGLHIPAKKPENRLYSLIWNITAASGGAPPAAVALFRARVESSKNPRG